MINLYQILNLSPQANTQEIQAALQHAQTQQKIDEKTASAVRSWLLEPDVRMRYDARLKMEQPEFFQAAAHRQTLKVKTSHNAPSQPNPVFKIKKHSNPAPASVKQQWTDENGDQIIEYTPILWNPKVIAIWAFFLNPIFGAYLQALNWRELAREDQAKKSMAMMWGLLAFFIIVPAIGLVAGFRLPLYTTPLLWAGWFFSIGRQQIAFVREQVGEDYQRLGWFKPVGLAIIAFIGYVIVIIMMAYLAQIAGVLHPSWYNE